MINYIPHGAANAKPRKEIIKDMALDGFKISDRAFRNTINRMILDKDALICTTSHKGYYIPDTPEDVEINTRECNSRISKLIARREAVKTMALERGIL